MSFAARLVWLKSYYGEGKIWLFNYQRSFHYNESNFRYYENFYDSDESNFNYYENIYDNDESIFDWN